MLRCALFLFCSLIPSLSFADCSNLILEKIFNTKLISELNPIRPHDCEEFKTLEQLPLFLSYSQDSTDFQNKMLQSQAIKHDLATTTANWAQEYIGSDLVGEEIQDLQLGMEPSIAILDSGFYGHKAQSQVELFEGEYEGVEDHGTIVANLTRSHSKVSAGKIGKLSHLIEVSGPDSYGKALEIFKKSGFPHLIHHSRSSVDSSEVDTVLSEMASSNALVVSSGLNSFPSYQDKEKVHQGPSSVVNVGWIRPDGLYHQYSADGEGVDLVAPAGLTMLSSLKDGTYSIFGGAAGAAPLVSGSAANIMAVLGTSHPEIIKTILTKSATKFPIHNSMNGAGTLNAYKAFKSSLRLKEKCQTDLECLKREVKSDEYYDFSANKVSDESMEILKKEIPSCAQNKTMIYHATKCDLLAPLKELRKNYLLTQNKETGKLLSCVYNSLGFSNNARFYELNSKNKLTFLDIKTESDDVFFRHSLYMKDVPPEEIRHRIQHLPIHTKKGQETLKRVLYSLEQRNDTNKFVPDLMEMLGRVPGKGQDDSKSIKFKKRNEKLMLEQGLDIDLAIFERPTALNKILLQELLANKNLSTQQKQQINGYLNLSLLKVE